MRPTIRMTAVITMLVLASLVAPVARAQEAENPTATPTPVTEPDAGPRVPLAGLGEELERIQGQLDEATARVLDLEAEIEGLEADRRALDERIAVTAERIREQRLEVQAAEERLAAARARYRTRLIEVYKRGGIDPIAILLSSETISDFVSRASVLARIAEDDSRVVSDLGVALADTRYQAAQLDELLVQDRELQQVLADRLSARERTLADQEKLVAQLNAEARETLQKTRSYNVQTRAQWESASIPSGAAIPRATATVSPYDGLTWIVSAYMPRAYRTTGTAWTAVCSWYGPGFHGRRTASGQIFNENDLTCASRTLPFGTVLALTRGNNRIIVYVNDRGPFIAGRDLDLSKAAAQALGFGGVAPVHAEIVVRASD